jgi:PAS domain S-box-containing protein
MRIDEVVMTGEIIGRLADVMLLLDVDGHILDANPAALLCYGRTADEMDALNMSDIDLPHEPGAIYAHLREAADHGGVLRTLHRRSDGTVFPVEIVSVPVIVQGRTALLSMVRDMTRLQRAEQSLIDSNTQLEEMVREVIVAMGRVVEVRDPYTQGHEMRVGHLAAWIATEMGMPADEVIGVEMAGVVHDIGKLAVPIEILGKPGALTECEMAIVRVHPQAGYDILKDIVLPWPVAESVLQHHERMDGSGYPEGLRGEEIAITARILAVADVVEAMSSHRPYRPALGLDAAMAELAAHPDAFDPTVVGACVALFERGEIVWF